MTEAGRRVAEAITTTADSQFGVRGLPAGRDSVSRSAMFASGVYTTEAVPTLRRGPIWTGIHIEPGTGWRESVELDLHAGIVRHVLRHRTLRTDVLITRFLSAAVTGIGVQTITGPQHAVRATDPLLPTPESTTVTFVNGVEVIAAGDAASGDSIVVAAHDDVEEVGDVRTVTRFVGMASAVPGLPVTSAADRLALARRLGADELEHRHRSAWTRRWGGCGTWLPDRPDLERSIRFATYHLLSCASTATGDSDEVAIGARGLTGTAYRGHVFWDTDVFVVPALSAIAPAGARRALAYRWKRMEPAHRRARGEGRRGVRFPWESARDGSEVTPRTGRDLAGREIAIRTGEMEEHITADVAWAVGNHVDWTGDHEFLRGPGLEILVETARYWASRVDLDDDGSGHIRNVIGPDEYHEAVDDNAFTNLMARDNLLRSADAAARFGACDEAELRSWREIADCIVDGFDPATGLYEQFTGFHALTDIAASSLGDPPYSADVLLGREATAQSRIIKQPDVLMAYHLIPDRLRADAFDQNLEFYAPLTAHGSSLSPAIMASLFFRARRWSKGMPLFELAGSLDLDDLTGTTAGGLHLATMGGVWQAVTHGMLGVRADRFGLTIDPTLPPEVGTIRHRFTFRGAVVTVEVDGDIATVTAADQFDLRVGGAVRRGPRHRLSMTKNGWEHR